MPMRNFCKVETNLRKHLHGNTVTKSYLRSTVSEIQSFVSRPPRWKDRLWQLGAMNWKCSSLDSRVVGVGDLEAASRLGLFYTLEICRVVLHGVIFF